MIWSLGGLVLVAAARNEEERALRLAVVVERVSREYSFTTWSFRLNQINEAVERIRKKLGPRRSEQTWNEALAMTTSSALEYAVADSTSNLEEAVDAGPLSRREREVTALVASGMTNKEIAQRLFIAERTAEGHVERIRNKLGVRSRTEVATWAVAHGLGPRQP
jgi:non-specific serine/threonine protein kinase